MASFSGKVTIDDVDFAGKRVVCRVDYNVPMKQKNDKLVIADTGRIDASIPTLKKILSQSKFPRNKKIYHSPVPHSTFSKRTIYVA